jgi:protein translocase SecG subunit
MNPLLLAAAAKTTVIPTAVAPAIPKGAIPQVVPSSLPVPPPGPMPQTWFQIHAPWLTHGLAGLFVICAVLLIVLLALQTTKQEGLTGSIGGRVEGAYRGRLGAEEQLKRVTGIVAVCFVIFGLAVSLTGI